MRRKATLSLAVLLILLAALVSHDTGDKLGWLGVALWALSEL